MKLIQLLVVICVCSTGVVNAQNGSKQIPQSVIDSIKEAHLDQAAFKNPAIRQASFLADVHGSSSMSSKLNDQKLFDADMLSVRYFGKFSMPIYQKRKNIVSTSTGLRYETFQLSNVVNYHPELMVQEDEFDKAIINLGLHYTRLDTVFHKPLTISTMAGGMIDPDNGQSRFTATVVALMTLKRTETFAFSAGAIISVDPMVPAPFIPIFSLYKRFGTSGFELTADPSGIALIKTLNEKSTLGFSNRIDGSLALFEFDSPYLPKEGVFSTLEVKSGLTYERLVGKKIVLTFSTGLSSALNSRTLEKGKAVDPFIQNKQSSVVYGQFGVSLLPFWKGLSKH